MRASWWCRRCPATPRTWSGCWNGPVTRTTSAWGWAACPPWASGRAPSPFASPPSTPPTLCAGGEGQRTLETRLTIGPAPVRQPTLHYGHFVSVLKERPERKMRPGRSGGQPVMPPPFAQSQSWSRKQVSTVHQNLYRKCVCGLSLKLVRKKKKNDIVLFSCDKKKKI